MNMTTISGRYGYRGAWLIVLGTSWVLFGVGILLNPAPGRSWVLIEMVPSWIEAAGWWASGLTAIVVGLRARPEQGGHDWPGHVALYLMPAVRLVSFGLSFVIWCASNTLSWLGWPDNVVVVGWASGWYAALFWMLVSLMLRHVAEWPNPGNPIPSPPARARERS